MTSSANPRRTQADQFIEDCQWIEQNAWIVPKSGVACRLRFNRAQQVIISAAYRRLKAGRPLRLVILKARQLGISTLFVLLAWARSYRRDGYRCMVLAHQDATTKELWAMLTPAHARSSPELRRCIRRFARANGPLVWKHHSRMACHTARGHGVGHGGTLAMLHLSEASRYGTGQTPLQQARVFEAIGGIRASLADTAGSVEVIESTANGLGGWFYEEWRRATAGESDYTPIFVGWWLDPQYVAPLGTGGIGSAADLDDYERSIRSRFHLSLEQLCWRRAKIANEFVGDADRFREQYPSSPEEAFLVSGSPVFDRRRLEVYLHHVREPIWRGEILFDPPAGWILRETPRGPVSIWQYPRRHQVYAIGADTAECLDDKSDRDAAVVRNARTLDVVAQIAGRFEPGEYARMLAALGWYYQEALLAVERNNTGLAVVGALRGKLGGPALYRKLYRYRRVDKATGKSEIVYGFPTTGDTKAAMVEAEGLLLREGRERNPSADILREALSFVHLPSRKMGAAPGAFDDLVIAWCISAFVAPAAATAYKDPLVVAAATIDELIDQEHPFD